MRDSNSGGQTSPSGEPSPREEPVDRRSFVSYGGTALMAGGLTAGYGMFAWMGVRFLYETGDNEVWHFVSSAASMAVGASLNFRSPGGVQVTITRREAPADRAGDAEPTVDDFLALSSICPHLGCRVHWESQNNRFFCPCHNGVFDPSGAPVSGPPAAANQALPQYPLALVDGALYIRMPRETLSRGSGERA